MNKLTFTYLITVLLVLGSFNTIKSEISIKTLPAIAGNCDGSIGVHLTGSAAPFDLKLFDDSGDLVQSFASVSTSFNITDLCPGEFTLLVLNKFGCEKTFTGEIREFCGKVETVEVIPSAECFSEFEGGSGTGSITIQVPGGAGQNPSVSWTGPNGYSSSELSIDGLTEGAYTVSVSIGTCNLTSTIDVCCCASFGTGENCFDTNGSMSFSFSVDNVSDTPNGLSSVSVFPFGGSGNYEITIEDSRGNIVSNSNITRDLADGTYIITVSDGCTQSTREVEIEYQCEQDFGLETSFGQSMPCNEEVNVIANHNNGNFVYKWSTGQSTKEIATGTRDEYCVTITNIETGCIQFDCIALSGPYAFVESTTPACEADGIISIGYSNPNNDAIQVIVEGMNITEASEVTSSSINIFNLTEKSGIDLIVEIGSCQFLLTADIEGGEIDKAFIETEEREDIIFCKFQLLCEGEVLPGAIITEMAMFDEDGIVGEVGNSVTDLFGAGVDFFSDVVSTFLDGLGLGIFGNLIDGIGWGNDCSAPISCDGEVVGSKEFETGKMRLFEYLTLLDASRNVGFTSPYIDAVRAKMGLESGEVPPSEDMCKRVTYCKETLMFIKMTAGAPGALGTVLEDEGIGFSPCENHNCGEFWPGMDCDDLLGDLFDEAGIVPPEEFCIENLIRVGTYSKIRDNLPVDQRNEIDFFLNTLDDPPNSCDQIRFCANTNLVAGIDPIECGEVFSRGNCVSEIRKCDNISINGANCTVCEVEFDPTDCSSLVRNPICFITLGSTAEKNSSFQKYDSRKLNTFIGVNETLESLFVSIDEDATVPNAFLERNNSDMFIYNSLYHPSYIYNDTKEAEFAFIDDIRQEGFIIYNDSTQTKLIIANVNNKFYGRALQSNLPFSISHATINNSQLTLTGLVEGDLLLDSVMIDNSSSKRIFTITFSEAGDPTIIKYLILDQSINFDEIKFNDISSQHGFAYHKKSVDSLYYFYLDNDEFKSEKVHLSSNLKLHKFELDLDLNGYFTVSGTGDIGNLNNEYISLNDDVSIVKAIKSTGYQWVSILNSEKYDVAFSDLEFDLHTNTLFFGITLQSDAYNVYQRGMIKEFDSSSGQEIKSFTFDGEANIMLNHIYLAETAIHFAGELSSDYTNLQIGSIEFINSNPTDINRVYISYVMRDEFSNLQETENVVIRDQEALVENKSDLRIIPNPFTDEFYLSLTCNNGEKNIQYAIYDSQGNMVHTANMSVERGENSVLIDELKNMKSGIYTLVLSNFKGEVKSAKIIKVQD